MQPVALLIAFMPIDLEAPSKRFAREAQVDRFVAAKPGEHSVSEFLALAQPIDSMLPASLRTSH
jgi:hypothetical protein